MREEDLPVPSEASSAVIQAEIEDLSKDLEKVRGKKRRHALWALLGLSPAALLPAIGLALEGSDGLLVLLVVLVVVSSTFAWAKNHLKEKELKDSIRRLRGEPE